MTTKPLARLLLTLLALAGCEAALLAAGGGRLVGPDLGDPGSWPTWLLTRPPDVAVMALVRWAGLVVGGYLLAVTFVGGLARTAGSPRLVRATDRVTPRSVRRFLDRLTGMAAVGAVVVGSVAGVTASTGVAAADPAGGPPTTRQGPPITLRGQAGPRPGPLPTTTTTIAPPAPGRTTEERVAPPPVLRDALGHDITDALPPATKPAPPGPPGPPGLPGPGAIVPPDARPSTAAPPAPYGTPWNPGSAATPADPRDGQVGTPPSVPADGATPPTPSASVDGETWHVERGDHFWSIAERVLADRWGRSPTSAEVDGYWRALVAANRTRLADPDNPDLLFTGQVISLPPVPAAPPLRPAA